MCRFFWLSLAALLVAGIAVGPSGGATQVKARWVITELGPCDANRWGCLAQWVAINDRGQVTGTSGREAFIWQGGEPRRLGSLGGRESTATDINDHGQIVGLADTRAKDQAGYAIVHAFLWENGRMRDLGVLGGRASGALAINDRGCVVGWAETTARGKYGEPIRHAFLWRRGRMQDLDASHQQLSSDASGINERGWIIGWWRSKAVLWRGGRMTVVSRPMEEAVALNDNGRVLLEKDGTLVLWRAGTRRLVTADVMPPFALDRRGRVFGTVSPLFESARIFVWEQGRKRVIGRGYFSAANERGQIVGSVGLGEDARPSLWENGSRTTLPLLPGHTIGEPLALNERNQIVGWSGNLHYRDEEKSDAFVRGRIVLWTLKRG